MGDQEIIELEKKLKEDYQNLSKKKNTYSVENYKPFFSLLKKNNYKGWLVVEAEQDPIKANPFEYAKIGYNYLKKTLDVCEISISK